MRLPLKYLAFGLGAVLAVGCSDVPSSPSSPSSQLRAPQPTFDYTTTGRPFGDLSSDFVLTSRGGTFSIGGGLFAVNFPANSVCDPAQSTYGDDQWDAPCVTIADGQSITVHATVRLALTGLAVDFSPELRFSPATTVTLSTDLFAPFIVLNRAYFASHPTALDIFALGYAPTLGSSAVTDFLSDPSLRTHVNLTTGHVYRRIKHFSGYVNSSGLPCDPADGDPTCHWVDTDGIGGP